MSYKVLSGWRVVDLGIVTAGASTSAVLADLGAEVIKVEGPRYTDPFREWTNVDFDSEWWNESPQFRATNRNKLSACIDLKAPEGIELFLDLAARSDVVLENFRFGVLDRLGISFERLVERNPRIILASISSQGQTGPEREKSSFGSTLEASSGMAHLMRYPGVRPQITGRGMNYPDQVASLFSASAVIAALLEARTSGEAMHVDLSQRELTAFLIAEELVSASAIGQSGNAEAPHQAHAVNEVFAGSDDRWVAVTSDLAQVRSVASSVASLSAWIATQSAHAAAAHLRSLGARAEVVWTAADRQEAGWRGLSQAFAVDDQGHQVKGLPLQIGETGLDGFRSAPALGRDNKYVACDILGLDEARYAALCEQGILATRPRKAKAKVS